MSRCRRSSHPSLDGSKALCLGGVSLDGVVNVDQDEKERDQHCHPAGDHLRVDQEAAMFNEIFRSLTST